MKSKKTMALFLALTMSLSMATVSYAEELKIEKTEESASENSELVTEYDVYDFETGEEYTIPATVFHQMGEEVTIPSKPAQENLEMIPLTEEELQERETYYQEQLELYPELYGYKGEWSQVGNVNVLPYSAIARLKITWSDGTIEFASGAAVNDGVVLTAAHCVYDHRKNRTARSIDIYFGENRGSYVAYAKAKQKITSAGWQNRPDYEPEYDYAVLTVDRSVTNKTGTLSVSTVLPTTSDVLTLTGYPYLNNKGNICYTDTGNMTKKYAGYYKHSMNCTICNSGSPVYKDYGDDWVVCGIHSGDYPGERPTDPRPKGGAAKTIDSNVLNLIKDNRQ